MEPADVIALGEEGDENESSDNSSAICLNGTNTNRYRRSCLCPTTHDGADQGQSHKQSSKLSESIIAQANNLVPGSDPAGRCISNFGERLGFL